MPAISSPQWPAPSDASTPWLLTIAASAGGIEALQVLLHALPRDLSAAVVVLLHPPAVEKIAAR